MGRHKGGMIIGIKKTTLVILKKNISSSAVLLELQNKKTLDEILKVNFAYFSPSKDDNENFEKFADNIQHTTPEIIMADCNARIGQLNNCEVERNSKELQCNKRGKYLIKSICNYRILNGTSNNDRDGEFTFISKQGCSVVDLCLVSNDFLNKNIEFQIKHTHLSQHAQIFVTTGKQELQHSHTKIPRIKWEQCKRLKFLQHLHQLKSDDTHLTPDNLGNLIYTCAKKAGLKTTTEFKGKCGPAWIDKDLVKLKCIYRHKVKLFRKCDVRRDSVKFHFCKNEMLNAKTSYLTLSKEKKFNYFNDIQDKIAKAKDGKQFWDALDVFRKSRKSFKTDEIELDTWRDHFSSVFSEVAETPGESNDAIIEDNVLDGELTMFELCLAIKKLSKNKAPGSDGIPNEIWKNLTTNVRINLLYIFNTVFKNPEFIPKLWSEIVIVPIFKKGDASLPGNYRPISLLNTITKLFTTLLTTRLDRWCTKNKKISEFQAGFKSGTGCVDQAFILNTIIQSQLKSKNGKLFSLFVDLSQAFDSVNHNILWKKLKQKGVSTKFMNVIKKIYSEASACVRVNGSYTDSFRVTKSVLQGESLSPKLFTLFLDDIVNHVSESGGSSIYVDKFNVDMLLFADDISVLALNANDLQLKINSIKSFFDLNNLKVNLTKTKVVIFRRKAAQPNFVFWWSSEKIEIVEHYTYLGIIFHYSGKFDLACAAFLNKAKQAQGALMKLYYKARITKFELQEKLYKSLCSSVLLYGVVVWGMSFIEKLCIFQNKYLRNLYYLPNETPRYKLLLETNSTPMEEQILSLILRFLFRICNKPSDTLVKSCFNKLAATNLGKNINFNWYAQVTTFLDQCKITDYNKSLKFVSNMRKVRNLLNKFKTEHKHQLILNMKSSSELYKNIKPWFLAEPYLNLNLKFSVKRLIFQIRCGSNYIYQKEACELLGTRKNGFKNCDLCDLGIEDVHHIFCVCPHYNTIRTKFMVETQVQLRNINKELLYANLFRKTNNTKMLELIYDYWQKCMRIRKFIRTY